MQVPLPFLPLRRPPPPQVTLSSLENLASGREGRAGVCEGVRVRSLYGPAARFTLSLLESLSEDWLTISDWEMLAEASLGIGQDLSWKAEMSLWAASPS